MQTSHKLPLAMFLCACLAIVNCQVVIGVSNLEVTSGTGGQGGGSSQSNSSSSSGTCSGCMPYYGCDATGKECATKCDESSGCADDGVCFLKPQLCMGCGAVPPLGPCPGQTQICEVCDSGTGTCILKCDTPGECAANVAFDGGGLPIRIECNDQCNNMVITSVQTAPIEVICTSGCHGLTLNCSPDGSCTLNCKEANGCLGAKVNCGNNDCLAVCPLNAIEVQQTCNGSCACTKSGCL